MNLRLQLIRTEYVIDVQGGDLEAILCYDSYPDAGDQPLHEKLEVLPAVHKARYDHDCTAIRVRILSEMDGEWTHAQVRSAIQTHLARARARMDTEDADAA